MSERPQPPKRGATLDLSTGATGRVKRARPATPAVITQTINLSTPKPASPPPEASTVPAPAPHPAPTGRPSPPGTRGAPRGRSRDAPRDGGARGGGHGLADLLDEATLARLRGLG